MIKKRLKRSIATILWICMLILEWNVVCYATNHENAPKESELYAKAAVLMDADSGRILYGKNAIEPMANASTTKIVTCILALELCELNAIVTVSARASAAPKVHLGMKEGQRFYLLDLLHALMLESYNDCAVAIAEYVAGSVEDFAGLMNRKAEEIGCTDTYFITPNGLDASDKNGFHHTTASDLAKLMRYCILQSEKKEEFRAVTATRTYSFQEVDSGQTYSISNRNAFLDMMQGAFSGKTGFTGNAGYCYVGALSREGKTYIVALLACGWPNNKTYKWSDSKKLMQFGIENFVKVDLTEVELETEKLKHILVLHGQGNAIGESVYTELKIGEVKGISEVLLAKEEEIKVTYQIKQEWEAPVAEGSYAGKILVTVGGELLREYTVETAEEVKRIDFFWCMKIVWEEFLSGVE